jgi:hypothetical protein
LRALSGANIELLGEAVSLATPDGQVRLARSVEPALLGAAGNVAVTGVPGSGKTVLQAADIHPRPAENGRQAQCGAVAEVRRHARWAARTMFLEIPSIRAIALTGIPSARCSLRASAQSSTVSTLSPPGSHRRARRFPEGVRFQPSIQGPVFHFRVTRPKTRYPLTARRPSPHRMTGATH